MTVTLRRMVNDGGDARSRKPASRAFWWKLTDNAFRRLPWLLLPVIVLGGIGFVQAGRTLDLYESNGVLSATSNPLIPETDVASTGQSYWETTAEATSRTINERLSTDAFMEEVAIGAGLEQDLETGVVELDIVRSSVWSYADGTSLVQIRASWDDPQIAFALADSTITTYQQFIADTVASDSSEAIDFYTTQLEDYQLEVQRAEDNLVEYVDGIPGTRDPTLAESLQIERLTDAVRVAEDKVAATEDEIERARLTAAQARSEAGRALTVIDPPQVPTSPESTLLSKVLAVVSYVLLGAVVAIGILLVTTVLDHSVSTASDLMAVDGVDLVATVPRLDLGGRVDRGPPDEGGGASSPRPTRREPAGARS